MDIVRTPDDHFADLPDFPFQAHCAEIPGRDGARGQPHTTIEGAGHFLQEDRGPELAQIVARFIAALDAGRAPS